MQTRDGHACALAGGIRRSSGVEGAPPVRRARRTAAFAAALALIGAAPATAQLARAASDPSARDHARAEGDAASDTLPAFLLTFELGVHQLSGDEARSFHATPGFGLAVGLRPQPSIQLDAGLLAAVGAAGIGRTIQTTIGPRTTSDYEWFLLLGGRWVLPLAQDQLLLSAGGGWAYASYEEDAGNISREIIYCTSCMTPTHGHGSYVLAEADLMVSERVGIGLVARAINVTMNDYFNGGSGSSPRPKDSWASAALNVTLKF